MVDRPARRDIAFRARREGTAAETAGRRIEDAQAFSDAHRAVVEGAAVRIVKMAGQTFGRQPLEDGTEHGGNTARRASPVLVPTHHGRQTLTERVCSSDK